MESSIVGTMVSVIRNQASDLDLKFWNSIFSGQSGGLVIHPIKCLTYFINFTMPIDINLLRVSRGGNPDLVRKSQKDRFASVELVDEVIALDDVPFVFPIHCRNGELLLEALTT